MTASSQKQASRWRQEFFENNISIEMLSFPEKLHTKLAMLGIFTMKDLKALRVRDLLIDKLAQAGPVTPAVQQEFKQIQHKMDQFSKQIITDFEEIERHYIYRYTKRINIPISRPIQPLPQVQHRMRESPEDFFFSLGQIFSINGESGTGKTSLLIHMCMNIQWPKSQGGMEGSAVLLDCDGSVCLDRVVTMGQHFCNTVMKAKIHQDRYKLKEVMSHIHFMRISDMSQFDEFFELIDEFLDLHTNVKLIAIDHFTFLARSTSLAKHYERKAMIESSLKKLKQLAGERNICIIMSNVLGSKMDKTTDSIYQQPIYGQLISLYVHNSILLERHGESIDLVRVNPNTGLPKMMFPSGYLLFSVQEKLIERYTKEQEMAALLFDNEEEEDQDEAKLQDGFVNPLLQERYSYLLNAK